MYRINKSLLLFAVLIPIFAFGQNESKKLLQSSTSSEINDKSSKLKLTVIDTSTISNFKLDNSIKQELKQADIYNSKTQKEDSIIYEKPRLVPYSGYKQKKDN